MTSATDRESRVGKPCPALSIPLWKRAMDVVIASTVLIAVGPILLCVGMASRVFLGPNIFFRQRRGGHGGSSFDLLKLRSMTDERGPDGELLPDTQRLHWWGSFLRRTSIDELPGLVNVLRGEMSIVGPRPFLAIYLERYDEDQALRHRLRPGLTGLAQVRGRNHLSWEERFELDNRYIDELSLIGDVRLLAETVGQVAGGRGADGAHLTAEFMGSPSRLR